MESTLEDRRCQPLVDRALATNGFAIVPVSIDPNEDRTKPSIEPLLREDDEDRQRLESVVSFLRRRQSRRRLVKLGAFRKGLQTVQNIVRPRTTLAVLTKLLAVLICVALATLALSPAGQNFRRSLIDRITRGSPPTSGDQALVPPADLLPSAGQRPAPTYPADESPPAGGPARTKQAPLRKENGTPEKAATSQNGSGRPRPSATVRPSPKSTSVASKPTPKAATPKVTSPRFAGSPRVELAGEPRSVGWGDSYAVRLLNPAGQPMVVAEIVLIAHMADGTVENIAMGALPEPGIYRATVPTRRSAPINLQVRLRDGEKRVEIPVRR
jgi:hypothetical protein